MHVIRLLNVSRIWKFIAWSVLAVPVVLALAKIVPPIVQHNFGLHRLQLSFERVSHPAKTTRLAKFSDIGVFTGNGNHCDYIVGEVRETDETSESVLQHYKSVKLPHVFPAQADTEGNVSLKIEFEDEFDREEGIDWSYALPRAMARAKAHRTKGGLYVVYAIDAGYDPGGDLRCQ